MPTDLKISTASSASTLDGTEKFPCAQGGASKSATATQVAAYTLGPVTISPGGDIDGAISLDLGTAGINSAGEGLGFTKLSVDNLTLDGNTASTTNANGNLRLIPNGTGQVLFPFGTKSAPGIAFDSASTRGLYGANGGTMFGIGGANPLGLDSTGNLVEKSTGQFSWCAGEPESAALDTGIKRDSAATQLDTNGSTGLGYRLTGRVIEANTAGAGSPNLVQAIESRKLFTNEGATAENYHTLPSAVAGMEFVFYCQDADGVRIVANAGDTLRLGGAASAAAGFVRSAVIGSCVVLVCINATEWVATSIVGTWTVDI